MTDRQLFYEFGRMLYRMDALYDEFAKQSGLSPTVLWVLYALNDGGRHTQREICTEWDLPKSTVNTAITELKELDCVELVPIPRRRREMTILLTERGKAYADEVLKDIYAREADAFRQMEKDDLQIIGRLDRLICLLKGEDK